MRQTEPIAEPSQKQGGKRAKKPDQQGRAGQQYIRWGGGVNRYDGWIDAWRVE